MSFLWPQRDSDPGSDPGSADQPFSSQRRSSLIMTSTNREVSSTSAAFAFSSFAPSLPSLLPFPWSSHLPFDMEDGPGVEFLAARPRKRTRQDPVSESSQSSRAYRSRPGGEPSSRHHPLPSSPPPTRYPGDGLDFRRPIMSSTQGAEVIDLTNDPESPPQQTQQAAPADDASRRQRMPRFPRDILTDVVDLEDDEPDQTPIEIPSSPEVQFVGSTARSRPRLPPPRPAFMAPMLQMLGYIPRPEEIDTLFIGDGSFDFTFNLGPNAAVNTEPPVARDRGRNAYKPPSPPPEGFTRTVEEDDVVCCPNCDAELGVGDETKQQIWVAKQCGHVYCGECATNRSKSNAKKSGTPRVKPFSKCQVDGCAKPISARRTMFQIYL